MVFGRALKIDLRKSVFAIIPSMSIDERDLQKIKGPELLGNYKVVIFDLDNTVIDSWSAAVNYFKEILSDMGVDQEYIDGLHPEDGVVWDQLTAWAIKAGINQQQAVKIEEQVWQNAEMLAEAKPIPEAIELITQLMDSGIQVAFATSRPGSQKEMTDKWLKKHLDNHYNEDMLYIQDEERKPKGALFKAQVLQEFADKYGGVVYVEDHFMHAVTIIQNTSEHNVYVILSPTNEELGVVAHRLKSDRLIRIYRTHQTGLADIRNFFGMVSHNN